jgi:CHAT domain-containing protein
MPGTLEPLARRIETVYLPSAAALGSLRNMAASRGQAPRSAAVLADPVFRADDSRVQTPHAAAADNGYERLLSSRTEAAALATLLPDADVRIGFDARRDFFDGDALGQYRLLHLATHSVLNTRHPELSGVALSMVDRQGKPQAGFLPLSEVSRLKLGADLVVLSACETGLGKEVRGEGLVGLSRAFLFAGSPRVVASLWQVPDQATAELMKHFYTAMYTKHMRPAEALHTAQLEIRSQRRWARPYYWAGFVLQGDWR